MYTFTALTFIATILLSASAEMAPPAKADFKFVDKVVPPERVNKQILLPNGLIQVVFPNGTIGERLPVFQENLQTFKKAAKGKEAPPTRVLGDNQIKIAGNEHFEKTEARKAVFKSCSVQRDLCQIEGGQSSKPDPICQQTFMECITATGVKDLAGAKDMDAVKQALGDNAVAAAPQTPPPPPVATPQPAPAPVAQPAPAAQTPQSPPAPAPQPANSQSTATGKMAEPIASDFKFTDNVVPPERANKQILLPNGKVQVKFPNGTIGERFPIISEALQTFMGSAKGTKAPNLRVLGDGKIKIRGNAQFDVADGRKGVLKSCQIQRGLCEFRGGQTIIDPICEGVFLQCVETTGVKELVPADELKRAIESSGGNVTNAGNNNVQPNPAAPPAPVSSPASSAPVSIANSSVAASPSSASTSTNTEAPSVCSNPVVVTVTVIPSPN